MTKEKKTAEELAAMILQDLSNMDGCPKRGVTVTVYGLNPWNSMLTFGVDADPVPNKAELQRFCENHHRACDCTTCMTLGLSPTCAVGDQFWQFHKNRRESDQWVSCRKSPI
jgi:hypothetical protein